MKTHKEYWGFDTHTLDTKVKPQDDFYQFSNGGWLVKNRIPSDESRWGSFTILRHDTEKRLRQIINGLLRKKPSVGSPEQLVKDLYRSSMDLTTREKLRMKPLAIWRQKVREIDSVKKLLHTVGELHRAGFSGIWNSYIDQDSKNSSRYLLHLGQGGLGLPDRDYYLKQSKEEKRVRKAYAIHVEKLFRLGGMSIGEAKIARNTILTIETALAKISMSKEDTRDSEKTYHKKTISGLSTLTPAINWVQYLKILGAPKQRELIVTQPEFFRGINRLLNQISITDWQTYLDWKILNGSASLLSRSFVKEHFNFYGRILSGSKKMKPTWRYALGAVNGSLGEALGKLYVKRYFPDNARRVMNQLVSDLFVVYANRINSLDWMSSATKEKAIRKLHMMKRKIGYPSHFESYRGVRIDSKDFFGNMLRTEAYEHMRDMRRLKSSVDRNRWFMTPQTVNAYCSFNLNEIVFPAAILQFPFFDPKADDAVNYAAIGSVIGHEMTHGFDDQGSKFDGHGNMKRWWSKKDYALFARKGKILVDQFNQYTAAPGVKANGQLTLGENIADLGGLCIAYDAYQKHLKKVGRKTIDGWSPEQRFFFGFAQMERELVREEALKTRALTDPHSVAPLRVNGPLSNFNPFYEVFGVKKGDGLFRAPRTRAKIW